MGSVLAWKDMIDGKEVSTIRHLCCVDKSIKDVRIAFVKSELGSDRSAGLAYPQLLQKERIQRSVHCI